MLAALENLVEDVSTLHSKLILLIGGLHSSKTALLNSLAKSQGVTPLNVGAQLGDRLASMPQRQRHFQTTTILRELADQLGSGDLLLLDNIELLFDRSLQLDPLDLLKRHAHARRVVAVWPGELQGDTRTGQLTYAEMGHPEHQNYSLAGVVTFEI